MKNAKGKKKSIFLRIALLAFSIYVIVMLIQLQMQIEQSNERLVSLDANIAYQKQINGDIKNKVDDYETYSEQQAREQGMAIPGEIIFKETPGS